MSSPADLDSSLLWYFLGVPASVIFYGRFYVQWIASEIRRRSVMPVAFWYMSGVGSVLLLVYGVVTHSALGTLSHCFNIVVYSRNLVHIWREKGRLSRGLHLFVHAAVPAVIAVSGVFTVITWWRVFRHAHAGETVEVARTALWLGIGVAGQMMFALRFLVQWIATERRRKSVIPTMFWWLSLGGSLLMCASHAQQREWVYAAGLASTLAIYVRNLWLIQIHGAGHGDGPKDTDS